MVSLLSEILYTNIESVQVWQHKLLLLKDNFKNSDKQIREFFQKQNLLNSILEICEGMYGVFFFNNKLYRGK